MDFDHSQLRALSAAVTEGTFEAAARALHVTPSAISQRLKALETATGRVLLVRSTPVQPTTSGQAVLRLARQVALMAADTARELGVENARGQPMTIPIAVNADSLATWVLAPLASLSGALCFDIRREDQGHTSSLLREGAVVAAVTAQAAPVPGCTSTRLGSMRYRPMAAAGFAARWFPDNVTPHALANAPVVVFDRKDDLQHRYLRRRAGTDLAPPVHHVPSSADLLTAVRLGLGWAMIPDLQSAACQDKGEFIEVDPEGTTDVDLHWQQWRLRSPSLDRVAGAILDAAREHLDQPRPAIISV